MTLKAYSYMFSQTVWDIQGTKHMKEISYTITLGNIYLTALVSTSSVIAQIILRVLFKSAFKFPK